MSHETDKRSSPLWFPVVFAIVRNLTLFRPFLPRDCLFFAIIGMLHGVLCRKGSVGKV